MPAFSLDPAQTAWCAELRAMAAERLRPLAEKGEPGHVNRPLIAELGQLGLLRRLFTSGALDLCLMRESLAYACTEAETALALQGLGAYPIHAYGTPAQRERWLPRVGEGTAVAAFALSEPGAGSDAAALTLRAERDGAPGGERRGDVRDGGPRDAAPGAEPHADVSGGGRHVDVSGPRADVPGGEPHADVPGGGRHVDVPGGEPRVGVVGAEPRADVPGGGPRGDVPGGEPHADVPGGGRRADVPGGEPRVGVVGAEPRADVPGGGPRGDVPGGEPHADVPGGGRRADVFGGEPRVDVPGAEPRADVSGAGPRPAPLAAESDGPARWRLTGEKCWISNAPEADFYTVFARTTPGAGARGVTAFLVPADRPGLAGTALDMLSPHPIGVLDFDAVPVTADDVLGEVDRGFRVAMGTLNLFRPSVGAFAVGMAQAALDATLAHTAQREAFGGKLKDLQTVAHQVAELALRTDAARLMVYAAATAYDEGASDVPKRAAMAKLLATETAQYVVDTAVQLHGARALQRGHILEHLYREVRAPRIYEGASEVQRGIIAKELYANLEASQ